MNKEIQGDAEQNQGVPSSGSKATPELSADFTPGPWSLTNDETYIRPDCLKGTRCLDNAPGVLETEAWPAICDVRAWPQERWNCLGPEESRANARLIAAAPALYAALEATPCRKSRYHLCNPSGDMCDRCAALALARGQHTSEQEG